MTDPPPGASAAAGIGPRGDEPIPRGRAAAIVWRTTNRQVYSADPGGVPMSRTVSAVALAFLLFGCSNKKEEVGHPNPQDNPGPKPQAPTPNEPGTPGPTRDQSALTA